MELKYPQEEYMAFKEIFLKMFPDIASTLKEEQMIEGFNALKDSDPNMDVSEFQEVLPDFINTLISQGIIGAPKGHKMPEMNDQGKQNIAALNSLAMGE